MELKIFPFRKYAKVLFRKKINCEFIKINVSKTSPTP